MKEVHDEGEVFKCEDHCGKVFREKRFLKAHLERVKASEQRLQKQVFDFFTPSEIQSESDVHSQRPTEEKHRYAEEFLMSDQFSFSALSGSDEKTVGKKRNRQGDLIIG